MKAAIIISLLCLSPGFALHAQKLSEKQLRSDEAKRSKVYKKYLKEPGQYRNQLSDTLKQQVKTMLKDSISNYLPDVTIDSTLIDQQTQKIKNIAKDSLKNYVPGVSLDSTVTDELKEKAKVKAAAILEDASGKEIPDITIDSTTTDQQKEEAKVKATATLEDAAGVEIEEIKIDSTATNQVKKEAKELATSHLEDATGMEIGKITLDSTTSKKVENETIKHAEEVLKNTDEYKAINNAPKDTELSELEGYKVKVEQTQEEIRQAAAKKELKKKMAAQAKQYIQEHADKIRQVQEQMGALKKKYSYVPNSNDLSSAVKRSSLKGETFWKRLIIGGNFNISKTNPLNIDLSPVIGYKINKLFEVGITGAFRTQFSGNKNGIKAHRDKDVYGYSIFANHMAFKNFFGYLEGERIRTTSLNNENQQRVWKQTLLIGIGRKIGIAKWLEMQAMVLVNVLHDNQDGLYNSPVVFKTGVRIRK